MWITRVIAASSAGAAGDAEFSGRRRRAFDRIALLRDIDRRVRHHHAQHLLDLGHGRVRQRRQLTVTLARCARELATPNWIHCRTSNAPKRS
jgi:hypothetical protein